SPSAFQTATTTQARDDVTSSRACADSTQFAYAFDPSFARHLDGLWTVQRIVRNGHGAWVRRTRRWRKRDVDQAARAGSHRPAVHAGRATGQRVVGADRNG